MLSGKRRIVVGAALCAALVGALTGCSSTPSGFDVSAESIGQQAIGFTGSDSPNSSGGSSGWSSTLGCPQGFKDGFTQSLPAGAVVTYLDPGAASVSVDSSATLGDIPNCALKFSTNQISLTALVFLNMDSSYSNAIVDKLQADGFVSETQTPITGGVEQQFVKGALVVEIVTTSSNGLSAFAVMG